MSLKSVVEFKAPLSLNISGLDQQLFDTQGKESFSCLSHVSVCVSAATSLERAKVFLGASTKT